MELSYLADGSENRPCRNYLMLSIELPHARGQCGGREEQPHLQGAPAAGCRRAERSYSMFKVRRGGCEKISLVQGKEQWLHVAGAAIKRYPTSKVRETQVRR